MFSFRPIWAYNIGHGYMTMIIWLWLYGCGPHDNTAMTNDHIINSGKQLWLCEGLIN